MDHWLEHSNNSEQTLSKPETYTEIDKVSAPEISNEKQGPTSSSITSHEKFSTAYMNTDECMEIWNILKSWKLECVYQTCIGKNLIG